MDTNALIFVAIGFSLGAVLLSLWNRFGASKVEQDVVAVKKKAMLAIAKELQALHASKGEELSNLQAERTKIAQAFEEAKSQFAALPPLLP